eukprot:1156480-Pelagomonas_calceolata.AAC.6
MPVRCCEAVGGDWHVLHACQMPEICIMPAGAVKLWGVTGMCFMPARCCEAVGGDWHVLHACQVPEMCFMPAGAVKLWGVLWADSLEKGMVVVAVYRLPTGTQAVGDAVQNQCNGQLVWLCATWPQAPELWEMLWADSLDWEMGVAFYSKTLWWTKLWLCASSLHAGVRAVGDAVG